MQCTDGMYKFCFSTAGGALSHRTSTGEHGGLGSQQTCSEIQVTFASYLRVFSVQKKKSQSERPPEGKASQGSSESQSFIQRELLLHQRKKRAVTAAGGRTLSLLLEQRETLEVNQDVFELVCRGRLQASFDEASILIITKQMISFYVGFVDVTTNMMSCLFDVHLRFTLELQCNQSCAHPPPPPVTSCGVCADCKHRYRHTCFRESV